VRGEAAKRHARARNWLIAKIAAAFLIPPLAAAVYVIFAM